MRDLERAIHAAVHFHRQQRDKNGEPYVLHVLRVMVSVHGDTERIAAVLHDVPEHMRHPRRRLEQIRAEYGCEVGDAVDAMTRRRGEQYSDYIERCAQNELAVTVKLADIADNLDPRRLALLPAETREPLHERYEAARERLRQIAVRG